MMAFAFAVVVAEKWNAELPIDLYVQREIGIETLAIGSANVILQGINIRIGLAGVDVGDRAELDFFRQREDSPRHHSIRHIVRQDSIYIGPNHRLLKRNQHAGKVVQRASGLAANVGRTELVIAANGEANGGLKLAVLRGTGVGQPQERLLTRQGREWIYREEVR